MANTEIALNEHYDLLPPLLQDLIKTIGFEQTTKLVDVLGGCKIKVPLAFSDQHWLLDTLSHESMTALVRDFGMMDLDIPRAYKSILAVRNKQIKKDRKKGESIRTLAQRNKLTERQIFSILGAEINENQLDLFN